MEWIAEGLAMVYTGVLSAAPAVAAAPRRGRRSRVGRHDADEALGRSFHTSARRLNRAGEAAEERRLAGAVADAGCSLTFRRKIAA